MFSIIATTTILLIVPPDGQTESYYTEHCDRHQRLLTEAMPDATLICVPPSEVAPEPVEPPTGAVRPKARPADLIMRPRARPADLVEAK